jgi:hypothetical protein
VASSHPSAILRADGDAQGGLGRYLVNDLRVAAQLVATV